MINNTNNKNPSSELQKSVENLIGKSGNGNDDIKKLINSLSEEDIKRISGLFSNGELQKIAKAIINNQNRKE